MDIMDIMDMWKQLTECKIISGKEEMRELIDLIKTQLEEIDIKDCDDAIEVIKYSIKLLDNNYDSYLEGTTFLLGKWFKDIMHKLLKPNVVAQCNKMIEFYKEKDKTPIELAIDAKYTKLFTDGVERFRIEVDKDKILQYVDLAKSGLVPAKKQIKDCDDAFARIDEIIDLLETHTDDYFENDMFLLGKLYNQIEHKKSNINLAIQFKKILNHYNNPKPIRDPKVIALLDSLSKKLKTPEDTNTN